MKKNIFPFLFLLFSNLMTAQQADENFLLTTQSNRVGVSTLKLLDPYLSPLVYSGMAIRFDEEKSRFLSVSTNSLSIQQHFNLIGGMSLNPAKTSSMLYAASYYDFGIYHHFPSVYGVRLMAGGSWDVDFGYKMIARNINNPVNIDLATNFNFSGIAKYDIRLFKRVVGLQLRAQAPVLGCMFVPRGGASYYEMFDLWNLDNAIHFSSLHNKQGISGDIFCVVPFKNFTLNFGVKYNGLAYKANDMVFKRNEFSFVMGSQFDVIKFSGRNKIAPRNFINVNK